MPVIAYAQKNFQDASLRLIQQVNGIINEYDAMGYELTLRQVYYQLVARDIIPNNERSYKNLGNLISDGRLAGYIDWNAIVDRTRNVRSNSHWTDPSGIIRSAAQSFALDKWKGQQYYVEVWVEKDALVGIVERICSKLDVPFFSCRGYVSSSEMWAGAMRLKQMSNKAGRTPVILHLGDHDPSGKDMSRDIVDRVELFGVHDLQFERLALNMDQITKYNPPPNPTKLTDSRATGYIDQFGYECWELDALRPEVIDELIHMAVLDYRDDELYNARKDLEEEGTTQLEKLADNYDTVVEILGGLDDAE